MLFITMKALGGDDVYSKMMTNESDCGIRAVRLKLEECIDSLMSAQFSCKPVSLLSSFETKIQHQITSIYSLRIFGAMSISLCQ